MLEFNILKGQYLNRLDKNVVSADTTDLKAQFELTADFTGTITVWWRRSDVNNTYTSTLAADGTCTIPAEALAATDKAVYGPYDHDVFVSISDTGRTTTNEYKLTVQRSAFSTNATPGTGGNPTAYEELVEQFDELKAENEQFKTDITEQQETFENTVTENVDNIRYVVETETAPPIIEEASGAEITLDDSAYRQVRGLNLYGYSKQTQTTGAQLLDYSTLSGAQNGITPSIDDENYIILNGTATANAFIYVLCNIPSGTNTFISVNNPVSNSSISVYIRDEESTYSSEYIALDTANKTYAFASASVTISRFVIRVVQGTTLTNFRLRPMLNSGSSALPWESYSGGVASPSPDWAQPITSVGDGGSVTVESQGANLIDLPKNLVSSYGGISVKALGDGTFLYSGTATKKDINVWLAGGYRVTTPIITLKRGKYSAPFSEASLYDYDYYLNAINVITVPDGGRDITGIRAPSGVTGTYYNKIIYPMLNRGSTPLPWQPYVAPSSALITLTDSLLGLPVNSGGNYTDESGQQWIADYIYRRQTDGKWMLWRNCGRLEYDGGEDEDWTVNSGNRMTVDLGFSFPKARRFVLCNRGVFAALGNEIGTSFIYSHSFYYTPYPQYLAISEFKTWLQTNPLDVIYQLLSPTVEELPENVQTELNGLYTYNLRTDMWNNDGAYMNLKYVADTKTWINNKIAGLSTAMIENL